MKTIVQNGDPVLRQKASPVEITAIKSPRIKTILREMSASLAECKDGVAIAAPQIAVSLRIFVVAGKVFASRAKDDTIYPDKAYINPTFLKRSTKKVTFHEGCLSVRGCYGKIKRSEKVTIEAYDENGQKFRQSASGFLAEIFQHEIDHLEGILFIDTATDLEDLKAEA